MDSALISEYKQKIVEAGRFVTSCGVMSLRGCFQRVS